MIKTFVFDTNALISANLLPDSVSRKALDEARKIGILVYSETTLAEFSETFRRSKFDKYISLEKRNKEILLYERTGLLIQSSAIISVCRDPKDNRYLELGIDADAACIVTGDKDLLILSPFKEIPIITAAEFLDRF